MNTFFSRIAIATVLKKGKISAQNVKIAGKTKTQDDLITLLFSVITNGKRKTSDNQGSRPDK